MFTHTQKLMISRRKIEGKHINQVEVARDVLFCQHGVRKFVV